MLLDSSRRPENRSLPVFNSGRPLMDEDLEQMIHQRASERSACS